MLAYKLYAISWECIAYIKACASFFREIVLTSCTFIIQSAIMHQTKKTSRTINLDAKAFIGSFGGPAAMRALWVRCGLHLTKGAQDKWVMRQVIPTSRILEAVQVNKSMDLEFDLNSFVKPTRKVPQK